jgi:hypothetical protein
MSFIVAIPRLAGINATLPLEVVDFQGFEI